MANTKWGVFDRQLNKHVAPCLDNGILLASHDLVLKCNCSPQIEVLDNYGILIIHNNLSSEQN